MIKKKLSLSLSLVIVAALTLGFSTWYYRVQSSSSIVDAQYPRDRDFIAKLFEKDMFWLTTELTHDTDYMLQHRAKSKSAQDKGKLNIKVAFEHDQPTGFVAYYKENLYLGHVLFIDVDEPFRKQGWGYKLLDYAVQELKKEGVLRIELITRLINTSARALYTRYGFKEFTRIDEFIIYSLSV